VTVPAGPGAPPVPSVCLVILDGWGLAEPGPGNAVELAHTPVFDELWRSHAHTQLTASGRAVGLPDGQMGNSEVGHLNLGAGAVVRQDLTRIDDAVADGSFARNGVLRDTCRAGREAGRLHLVGLVSDGGVHSGWDHLRACIELAADQGVPDVVLHAFTDGRDTLPDSGAGFIERAEEWLSAAGGRVGSVSGRYYAMDRDRRWDRIEAAYGALVHGRGSAPDAPSGVAAVRAAYDRGETDEFVKPTVVGEEARIRDGDAVLFFNFRPDRARETAASRRRRSTSPRSRSTTRAGRTRWRSRPSGPRPRWPRRSPGAGCTSCTWRRPRSTRTSPTSSTAARRTRTRARSATWSTRRATCPPTTTSRR
jgi:2,3-bisphosphoglycerate-independent phosphoglycerate mutase